MIHQSKGTTLPVTKETFNGTFSRSNYEKIGKGFTIEGKIIELRNHTIQENVNGNTKYHRFLAVVIDVDTAKNRVYNEKGEEIESDQKRTVMKQKGFLSVEKVVEEDPAFITNTKLLERLGGSSLPKGLNVEGSKKLAPQVKDRFEFWGNSDLFFVDLEVNRVVRLKTTSDSHFIHSIILKDKKSFSASQNYAGEEVLEKFQNNIVSSRVNTSHHKETKVESGVNDDEWDD
eukprot:TRINITY_DN3617_c0_g1_i1.p1 TRINITY_DN3617_c0_g1~~TRINITY_DN3617_c0_g1_i1.p1  ORF type:complete len:231 (-),score=85.79 TRINITY_DN3617_c0_g1_i1:77-769(-)